MINGLSRSAYHNFKKIIDMDSDNIKAYLRLGQVLRESGNPEKALKIHKALTIRQNLSSYDLLELHKNISLDYFDIGRIDRAIEEALRVLKLDKKSTWAISKLMSFYIELNDWKKATEYLEKLHQTNKTKDPHKLGLFIIQQGCILQNNQEFDLARKKFEKSLEANNMEVIFGIRPEHIHYKNLRILLNQDHHHQYQYNSHLLQHHHPMHRHNLAHNH